MTIKPGKQPTSVRSRNRGHRLSESIISMLSTTFSTEKVRNSGRILNTTALSRAVILLLVLSMGFMFISYALNALSILRHIVQLPSPPGFSVISTSPVQQAPLSVLDYPRILVADSAPFNPIPKVAAPEHDEGQSIINMAHADDEVTIAKDADPTEDTAMRLIILTMDRPKSLTRLLNSLVLADYGEDLVDLDVWIDRPTGGPLDANILSICRNVTWQHGTKTIHKRTENAGLYKQWIYTWNITAETTEFAVILEDDLEVSPAFYQWLRVARAAYAQDPDVAAFTLQRSTLRPRQRKGVASGDLKIPAEHQIFKYRLLGTWGFAPQRDHWIEFRKWFENKRERNEKPYVDGLVTTSWYKSQEKDGFAPNMWSQWWIKFVDEKDYFTVTAHLPDGTTLASNWRESGLHYSKTSPKADFPVFRGSPEIFSMPDNPIVLDWDGLIINQTHSNDATG